MIGLQALHSGNALKCPSISAGVQLKLFCPWCLKLGGNMETIAIHFHEVHYQMTIACDICWAYASMTAQNIQHHQSKCKGNHNKECVQQNANEACKKAQKLKEMKSSKSKKCPNQNYAEQNAILCLPLILAIPVNECWFYLQMIPCSFPRWSHITFLSKPSLSQTNCLILLASHSCCSVMVLETCNHPGILFCILYLYLYIHITHFILYFTLYS